MRSLGRKRKKVQDCDHVFGSSTTFHRRKEWIFEIRCQVSDRLHVFFALKPFRDYSLCSVCIFFPVCSPHSAPILRFTTSLQSAVCILPLVRTLRFTLTETKIEPGLRLLQSRCFYFLVWAFDKYAHFNK